MNKKAVGTGLFVVGWGLVIVFSGQLAGIIPGIILMMLGVVFWVTSGKRGK